MSSTSYDIITLRFNENEIRNLVLALKERLRNRMKDDHYKNYPDSFERCAGPDMQLLRNLAGSINRYNDYAEILLEAESIMSTNKKALKELKGKQQ